MQNFGVDFLDGTHFHFGRHFGGLQTHSSLTDGQLEALLERAFQDMRTLAIQHENGAWMEVEFGEKGCFMVFSEQDGERNSGYMGAQAGRQTGYSGGGRRRVSGKAGR